MQFAVWAPRPTTVELVLDGARHAMVPAEDGWWVLEADAAVGARYGLSLDGGPTRPDPRSVWQPDGIEAPSAVYDHAAHPWGDDRWPGIRWPAGVLYELHLPTFSEVGTFDGAVAHLSHLVDLGVDTVEVMPVAGGPGRWGWGYDGAALSAVHEPLGGPDGFKRFVDACHQHGLAVVLDVVYNHLGPTGNHLAELGPYFTDRHQTPWGAALSFDDPEAPEVRRFVVESALGWLRHFHLDGLRLDAVHAILDDSRPHLLAELGDAVAALSREVGRELVVIAESDLNDPAIVRPRPEGYGLHAAWADDWHHALHQVLTGEQDGYYRDYHGVADLLRALTQGWVLDGRWSAHRGHTHGAPPEGLPASTFVVAAQNHDQVGNRATGERLSALTSEGRLRIAAALLLTSPFVPMLFQGEEWGASTPFLYFTDHEDPELGIAATAGRRHEFEAFGWDPAQVPDPQDEATFRRSVLRWDELEQPPHRGHLDWHRSLLALRRSVPDLHDPAVRVQATCEQGVLRVVRGSVTVLANLGTGAATVDVTEGVSILLSFGADLRHDRTLPVDSVVVLRTSSRTPDA